MAIQKCNFLKEAFCIEGGYILHQYLRWHILMNTNFFHGDISGGEVSKVADMKSMFRRSEEHLLMGISLDGMECEHVPSMNKIFIETHSISRKISLDGRSKPSVIHVE